MEQKVVTVERVVFGGKGLTRDLHKVAFIPFTLPGERVRVRVTKERADYLEAEALEILQSSPKRTVPDCRYYGICGGCQLSHAKYAAQVEMKENILKETFLRNGLSLPDIETFGSQPYGYRHRARLKFDARSNILGFFSTGTNQVVDVHECLCLTPGLNVLLKTLRTVLLHYSASGNKEIHCYENERGETAVYASPHLPKEAEEELSRTTRILQSDAFHAALRYRFRNYELPMHPDYFLQVNPCMWNAMVQEVESPYQSIANEEAVEFYSGSGFFTVPLSARFRKITAVEENPAAVRFSKTSHRTTNVDWICQKAEQFSIPKAVSVAILDPPRQGIPMKVRQKLLRASLNRITYISCDVSTLCRDLKVMCGKYRIDRTVLLDLFPQTYHFETVTHLVAQRLGFATA